MKYRCIHCGKTVDRDSKKAWISSYCDETGKMVRLMKKSKGKKRGC